MKKAIVTKVVVILLVTVNISCAGRCAKSLGTQPAKKAKANPVDAVLEKLRQKTLELKTYMCKIEYKFSQPLLFESETLRKGDLYYQKSGGKSTLRINFKTLKQDDEKEQKYREQYIFDGLWLTQIDYQLEQVVKRQLAEPNGPTDAFDLVSENFPIIGFSKTNKLKEEFEIKFIEQQVGEAENFTHLHLNPKPNAAYKEDYAAIDFWIDKKLYLPAKIVAVSTEPDIQPDVYQIRLLKPKVNKELSKKVFDLKIPKGFTVEIIPLKKDKNERI